MNNSLFNTQGHQSSTVPAKMSAAPLHRISAREALLAAALQGGRSSTASANAGSLFAGTSSFLSAPSTSMMPPGGMSASTSSLLGVPNAAAPANTQDILRDVYGIATAGAPAPSLASRQAALNLALQHQAQQRRQQLEQVQVMRQQAQARAHALAMANEMSTFELRRQAAATDQLRAAILNRAAVGAGFGGSSVPALVNGASAIPRTVSVPSSANLPSSPAMTSASAAATRSQQQPKPKSASSGSLSTSSPLTVGLQLRNVPNPDATLAALGSSMRKKNSPYIDASSIVDAQTAKDAEGSTKRRRTRGGVTEPFPERLHRMLSEVQEKGDTDIVSWYAHGRAFGVHDPARFVEEVLPKYFKQSRLSSFQRQLNLYGFTRISSGPDTGGYYHELFLKGRPQLCIHMRRVGVPQGDDRRKLKVGSRKQEPDFYSMKPVDR